MNLQKDVVILSKDELELTPGMYHIGVRTKFTTVTVGSFDMRGINCDLRRHRTPSER